MKQAGLWCISITVILYLLSAFIWADFNILKWAIEYRAFIGFIWLVLIGAIISFYSDIAV